MQNSRKKLDVIDVMQMYHFITIVFVDLTLKAKAIDFADKSNHRLSQAVVLGNIPKNLACVFFLIILRNFMKKFHQILHNYFQSELIEIYLLLGPNQKYSR